MQNKVSGKPDAGEWAEKFRHCFGKAAYVSILADFQRETLLAAARYLDDIGHGFAANEIRRQFLAESCGRGK